MGENRIRELEDAFQKVNYALFGLRGDNGLIGSLEKLASGQKQLSDRITKQEEKDDARWSALQWKIVAGMGAIIMLLVTVLAAILTTSS